MANASRSTRNRSIKKKSLDDRASAIRVRELRAEYITLPSPTESVMSAGIAAVIISKQFGILREVQENVFAIYVDGTNGLLGTERVFRGSVTSVACAPRDILRNALLLNAAAVIVVHNHPSGSAEASIEDVEFTRRFFEAARMMGIELLDHVILGRTPNGELHYNSLKERGYIPTE